MLRALVTFLAPFMLGLMLSQHVTQAISTEAWVRVWLLLAVAPAIYLQLGRQLKDTATRTRRLPQSRVVSTKSIALIACWTLVLTFACLMSQLQITPAIVFLQDVLAFLPTFLVVIPGYVWFVEHLLGTAHDDYYLLGTTLRSLNIAGLRKHKTLVLSWIVKAFFIPLMYGWTILTLTDLQDLGALPSATNWITWLFTFGLCIDLVIATSGYVFNGRLLGNPVLSVDKTILGWAACLVCYPPFLDYLKKTTSQVDAIIWSDWLEPTNPFYWTWAVMIAGSWMTYWLSTIAFGLRFSNLTYRGLVDIGPYRFCKHPAYFSKNVYWWLHTVPFVGVADAGELARNVAGLTILSAIYYLRARTEERHLMQFPEYVAYAQRIEQQGIRRRVQRWFGLPVRA
jgi:hypothetical protein